MTQLELGSVGEVVVRSILPPSISPGASGKQTLEAINYRTLTLDVDVVSKVNDPQLSYPDHGAEWTHAFSVGPFMSGDPVSSEKVAELRHSSTACPDGQFHALEIMATAHRKPVGPIEPVGSGSQDTGC